MDLDDLVIKFRQPKVDVNYLLLNFIVNDIFNILVGRDS
jgi:hypothetical protein